MPYIKQNLRDILDLDLKELREAIESAAHSTENAERALPGVLVYIFTTLLIEYYHYGDFYDHALVGGLLGATQKEFYRRSTGPYEDKKIEENGDVFPTFS